VVHDRLGAPPFVEPGPPFVDTALTTSPTAGADVVLTVSDSAPLDGQAGGCRAGELLGELKGPSA